MMDAYNFDQWKKEFLGRTFDIEKAPNNKWSKREKPVNSWRFQFGIDNPPNYCAHSASIFLTLSLDEKNSIADIGYVLFYVDHFDGGQTKKISWLESSDKAKACDAIRDVLVESV